MLNCMVCVWYGEFLWGNTHQLSMPARRLNGSAFCIREVSTTWTLPQWCLMREMPGLVSRDVASYMLLIISPLAVFFTGSDRIPLAGIQSMRVRAKPTLLHYSMYPHHCKCNPPPPTHNDKTACLRALHSVLPKEIQWVGLLGILLYHHGPP